MMTRQPNRARVLGVLLAAALWGCGSGSDGSPGDTAVGQPQQPPSPPPREAADPPPAVEPPDREPREGELLLATPPEGWKETGAMQTPVLRMAEYGPAQETEGRLERLTFEAQSGDPLPDPIQFVLAVSRDLAARCQGLEDVNISSGHENGYPTSVRLMICPKFKDSPHGQVVMAKAIRGNEQFYVITRRLRVAPMEGQEQPLSAQAMAEWTTHFKAVQVCDTRASEHPCPSSVTGAEGAGN